MSTKNGKTTGSKNFVMRIPQDLRLTLALLAKKLGVSEASIVKAGLRKEVARLSK